MKDVGEVEVLRRLHQSALRCSVFEDKAHTMISFAGSSIMPCLLKPAQPVLPFLRRRDFPQRLPHRVQKYLCGIAPALFLNQPHANKHSFEVLGVKTPSFTNAKNDLRSSCPHPAHARRRRRMFGCLKTCQGMDMQVHFPNAERSEEPHIFPMANENAKTFFVSSRQVLHSTRRTIAPCFHLVMYAH